MRVWRHRTHIGRDGIDRKLALAATVQVTSYVASGEIDAGFIEEVCNKRRLHLVLRYFSQQRWRRL